MKESYLKGTAIGLFVLLIAFNINTNVYNTSNADGEVNLSKVEAVEQSANENDGCGSKLNCYYDPGCSGPCIVVKCDDELCPHPDPEIGQGCHYCEEIGEN